MVRFSGLIPNFKYGEDNYLASITYPDNGVWRFSYDINGFMLTKTEPMGDVVTYDYDERHRVISSAKQGGKIYTYRYSESSEEVKTTYTVDSEARDVISDIRTGTVTKRVAPKNNAWGHNAWGQVFNLEKLTILWYKHTMARPLRIEYPGAVYHVTSRGNERKPIFQTDDDRKLFLGILHQITEKFNWVCHAYCLMDNHYHLIIEIPEGNLSKGMRQLNGVYTQAFNKRHNRSGHIFQGRYKAILIQKNSHLLEVCRYVVLNPVRAGAAEQPEDWSWSSYNATRGKKAPHPCLTVNWVLEQFVEDKTVSMQKYAEFVKEGIGQDALWDRLKGQLVLGDDRFVEDLEVCLKDKRYGKEIPRNQRHLDRPTLAAIFKDVKDNKSARNRGIAEAVYKHAYSQKEVADFLGVHYSTVSVAIKKIKD